ncbi:drug/metabolite transporter (DMT)-like permease [Cupriavidus metallidurans]|jgi:drug/metabolite transporter (DMT)-like permease|uniref:Predicted permease, DMT superfamily n=1 Tax=Cupriavidus metallidurans (strain ATCC 43123 / DSM 2839 / NBRC 102507 / CH34) TaxID=266264 RepID=Q1LR99_CUPMC|nr:DMT family transporter [Cupriavidus metallidurans]ABF07327.1 predicted permease, DMT superfamily [Cupriavidus metallidurans CH34]AVA32584.1 EamA/RhaT family transporter [Cupriavidus metallidurans]MDE4916748.1 DMT family transporter [Cupriavidus metallidurans]QGS28333.1 EamA family transporter [Cupriavidus metallidurans]UBM11449.1 DMT family transporter [Cupriavidus metallidurans]
MSAQAMTRRPLDGTAIGLMVLLCAAWGLQQVIIKVTAPLMGAVLQAGVRSAIAALLVFGFAAWRGTPLWERDGTLRAGLVAGLLFGAEFFCIFVGLGHTTASRMAVFLYTAPIFTALGLHLFVPGEHLHRGQWLGVVLAFCGIALAFADGIASPSTQGSTVIGDVLGMVAGALWAATTVVVRGSKLSGAPASKTLLYQLGVSAVMLLLMALAAGQAHTVEITGFVVASLFYQSVLIAFASYLIWFWLLRQYLASRLSVFSFLTPLFGVAFGVLLMHDHVGVRFALAAVMVLGGIVLVNRRA